MIASVRRFWRSFSLLMAFMLAFAPIISVAAPATAQTTPPSPQRPSVEEKTAIDTSQPSRQVGQTVTADEALAKIHPDLRATARSASPSLPGNQALAPDQPQGSVLIEVIAKPETAQGTKTEEVLRPYFGNQSRISRPPIGHPGMQTQVFIGSVQASSILKIAYQPEVEAILPVVLEQNGQPDNYPIDNPPQYTPKGPDDWAKLRAQADQLRAGSLPWDMSKALNDGKAAPQAPEDWFEVTPEGPHKAEVAWERGFTGAGISVAVNDDGVDFAHPDLMGTQKIFTSPALPQYDGWPMVFSPISMLVYYLQEIGAGPYVSGGYPGIHYIDTSATPALTGCGSGIECFTFTPLIDFQTPGLTHHYVISSTMTKSGVVHVGTHPDHDLRDYVWGELPAVLVTDPNVAGVYDTVYVDLNDDYDFRDEKPLTRADTTSPATLAATYNNMIAYRDMNGDGLADIGGGMLYYIADGQNPIPVSDWYYGADCTPGFEFMCAGNGDLIALEGGTFDRAYSHGTQCASNVVGQGVADGYLPSFRDLPGDGKPSGAVFGMAPDAKIVPVADIYYNFAGSKIDAWTFDAIGYDAIDQTGFDFTNGTTGNTDTDAIRVASNSFGSSDQDNDGWEYDGQYVSQVLRYYAPFSQYTFSTGNGGSGYGTITAPAENDGISVGASTEFGSTGWDTITDTNQIMNNDVIPFSDRGPSARGTNGTDVVADGAYAAGDEELNYYAISTWGELNGNLSWDSWGGTSRSSPVTSGIIALVLQAYHDTHGTWPTYDVTKAILESSATDLNYDTLTQGGGSVNADTATALAADMYGAYAMPSEWTPGDFRGADYPDFAHITYPGDTFAQRFALVNPTTRTLTATLTQGTPTLIGSATFTYTITPDMYAAKPPDNFFKSPQWIIPITATSTKIAQNSWWDNVEVPQDATLMVVRMRYPFNEYDANGDDQWDNRFRLMVYNWKDVNGDGSVWNDANGNGVVDFTTLPDITTIDQGQELDWANSEVERWEYGRFGYNRPGGNVLDMWVHDPLQRMFDGLFIGLQQYDDSTVENTHLSFEIDFYKDGGTDWLDLSGVGLSDSQVTLPPSSTVSFTATVTVPMDMPAGAYEAGIKAYMAGADGFSDNTTVIPVTLNVAKPFSGETTFGGQDSIQHDQNLLYNNGAVRGLFDWTWRPESGDWRFFFSDVNSPSPAPIFSEDFEGTFPPAGWTTQDNIGSGNVWDRNDAFGSANLTTSVGGSGFSADADSDATCNGTAWDTNLISPPIDLSGAVKPVVTFASNFQDFAGDGDAWLDVSSNNGSTWSNIYYQTDDDPGSGVARSFDLSAYSGQTVRLRWRYSDNGDTCAWFWQIDSVEVTDAFKPQMLLQDKWNDAAPHTDIDSLILGPTASDLGTGPLDFPEPSYYGPYTLDTIAKSPNTNVAAGIWDFNTSSGGAEDWLTAPTVDGLHEFLQHNVLFEGDQFQVPFTKTLGTLSVAPDSLSTVATSNQGTLGHVVISATLPLNGMVSSGFIADRQETNLVDEPLPDDGNTGTIDWVYPFTVNNGYFIDVSTSSANISDIDLYLFYNTGAGYAQIASSAGGTANEHIHIDQPPDGQYLVGVSNYSGPAGTFNMDLIVGVAQSGITVSGLPTSTLLAGTPVTATIHYNFPFEPLTTYQGEVHLGIPEAPDLVVVPFTITRVNAVSKAVDKDLAFPGDLLHYTIGLYNAFGPAATFTLTDAIPDNTEFVTVTNAIYDAISNSIVFSGTVPYDPNPVPGREVGLTVMVASDVLAGSDITNTAQVAVQHGAKVTNESASASTHIGATNFMDSYKLASPTVEPGGVITYEVHVINTGEQLAAVNLTDPIPTGTEFDSLDNDPPNQGFTYNPGQDQVEWSGNIAPDEERVFAFQVTAMPTVTVGTTVTNVAHIAWEDQMMDVEANTTVVQAMLSISKTGPTTVAPGDDIVYTITYANQGTATAHDVMIIDTLPISVTSPMSTTWTIGDLAPGVSDSVEITATVGADVPLGDVITNTAEISASNAESGMATFESRVGSVIYLPLIGKESSAH